MDKSESQCWKNVCVCVCTCMWAFLFLFKETKCIDEGRCLYERLHVRVIELVFRQGKIKNQIIQINELINKTSGFMFVKT